MPATTWTDGPNPAGTTAAVCEVGRRGGVTWDGHRVDRRGVNGLEGPTVAVPPRLDPDAWRAGFDDVFAAVAGRFAQATVR